MIKLLAVLSFLFSTFLYANPESDDDDSVPSRPAEGPSGGFSVPMDSDAPRAPLSPTSALIQKIPEFEAWTALFEEGRKNWFVQEVILNSDHLSLKEQERLVKTWTTLFPREKSLLGGAVHNPRAGGLSPRLILHLFSLDLSQPLGQHQFAFSILSLKGIQASPWITLPAKARWAQAFLTMPRLNLIPYDANHFLLLTATYGVPSPTVWGIFAEALASPNYRIYSDFFMDFFKEVSEENRASIGLLLGESFKDFYQDNFPSAFFTFLSHFHFLCHGSNPVLMASDPSEFLKMTLTTLATLNTLTLNPIDLLDIIEEMRPTLTKATGLYNFRGLAVFRLLQYWHVFFELPDENLQDTFFRIFTADLLRDALSSGPTFEPSMSPKLSFLKELQRNSRIREKMDHLARLGPAYLEK